MFVIAGGRRIVDAYKEALIFGRLRSGRLAKAGDAGDFGIDMHRARRNGSP